MNSDWGILLVVMVLAIFFAGEPDLMDAIINFLTTCKGE